MTRGLNEPEAAGAPPRDHFVGVDIGPAIIRAGVFSSSLRLVGKTKFSTKVERGATSVIERVAKCVAYAADECDLPMERIQSVGVGSPGQVNAVTGLVEQAPDLGWGRVPLGCELERRLALPVFAANIHRLGSLGIYHQEAKAAPERFAALFIGPQITGGLIVRGEMVDLAETSSGHPLEAPAGNVFATLGQAEFRHYRSRDFRKALRKGNQVVTAFIREMAVRCGQIAAELALEFSPAVIAVGGGVLDEMREEILRITEATARTQLKGAVNFTLLPSMLGDLAGMTGAAVHAAQCRAKFATAPDPVAV
jgi:glucokinase